jgi:hypothetical protein
MGKARREAAESVALNLFETEAAIDAALAKAAQFLGTMPVARQQAGVAAQMGNEAIMKAAEAVAMLTRARAAIVECHDELDGVQKELGLRITSFGPMPKPAEASSGLRIVSRAA